MDFLDDLEEDPVLRKNIDVYRKCDEGATAGDAEEDLDPEVPTISVEEMLQELTVSPASAPLQQDEEEHWQDALEDPNTAI